MYQVVWELKLKFKQHEKFEQFYAEKGEWVKFFSRSSSYQGTDILESGEKDQIFLVIDEWLSEEDYNDFIKNNKDNYALLEEKAKAASFSKKRIHIGF